MYEFPYLKAGEYIEFPDIQNATEEGIVAFGGNLSPGVLLSAYHQGIFPWFNPEEPILWWSPDPRCVLELDDMYVSSSLRKLFKKNHFSVTMDTDFERLMRECGAKVREGQEGTWISEDIITAYLELHSLGYAHSVEVWQEGNLAGGLYGVSLGSAFFGESMVSLEPNSSKYGLAFLSRLLEKLNFSFIDCQVVTPHLLSLGAQDMERDKFYGLLGEALRNPGIHGSWTDISHNFHDKILEELSNKKPTAIEQC
jgi:leucyl/phenylalanyl-tRNA--protein transferase